MERSDRSVTVFGLGLMGRPIARRLEARAFMVIGWNRSLLAEELIGGIGLAVDVPAATHADICLLMLADSDATDEVLAQLQPYLREGQVVLDMGSSDPGRSRLHAERLRQRGVAWVDAPVSGGPEAAANGTLAIMAGGTRGDVARVRPVLDALGRTVHVGPAGAGHLCKVVNQVIVGLVIEAVAEALVLAERAGLDPRVVQRALAGGFADSKILQVHGTRMIERAYVPGGRALTHLKDLRMALDLARRLDLRLPHLESAAGMFERLVAQSEGNLDHSALHKLLLDQGTDAV